MNYQLLQTVVLARDLPEQGLQRGDLGAVVELYEPDALDVESSPRQERRQRW